MNRTGALLAGVGLLLVVGALVASGAFVPFLAGPGYQPEPSPTATDGTDGTDGAGRTGGTDVTPGSESATPTDSRYEHVTVTVVDENGTTLGTVRAAVADTPNKRYVGLSKTESLPENRGMLFTYDSEGNHTYVMRDMDFGIDIVYIGSDGRIRTIHHAPEPPEGEDGEDDRYPGRGQYVLEVNYEWTTRHNVSEGDRVRIEGL